MFTSVLKPWDDTVNWSVWLTSSTLELKLLSYAVITLNTFRNLNTMVLQMELKYNSLQPPWRHLQHTRNHWHCLKTDYRFMNVLRREMLTKKVGHDFSFGKALLITVSKLYMWWFWFHTSMVCLILFVMTTYLKIWFKTCLAFFYTCKYNIKADYVADD